MTASDLVELRDALLCGDLNLDEFYLRFEIALHGFPYDGRHLPKAIVDLINKVELIRFGLLPENQADAAAQVANEAIRLLEGSGGGS